MSDQPGIRATVLAQRRNEVVLSCPAGSTIKFNGAIAASINSQFAQGDKLDLIFILRPVQAELDKK